MIIKESALKNTNASEHQQKRRGQRIFGVLLGTLNKFKDDSLQEKDLTKKRQAINNKLQEKLLEETKSIRESLLKEQENKAKLRAEQDRKRAEKKMYDSLVYKQSIAHYLITETKQHLKYLPKKLLPEQQEKIDQQIKKANDDLELYKEQQKEKDNEKNNEEKDNDEKVEKEMDNNEKETKIGNDDEDKYNDNDHASSDNHEQANDQANEHQREDEETVDYEG
ncbi:pinin/SDK/memA/ protein conserved region-domain-containing protein [Cunninghamella echinulata]|nr:pinin/SDK/memA/ protein conserved region-domain-containing protein [Cunninghamella echinulata]